MLNRYPTVDDLVPVARRRLPRFSLDYLEHGAAAETLVEANRAFFNQISITPRYLRDVSDIDTTTRLFDRDYAQPFGIAPIGLGGMIWPGADGLLADAARRADIAYVLSTVGTASIETAAANSAGQLWFQLYSPRDEGMRRDLLARAQAADIDVLCLTVDAPSRARRERPLRSGFSMTGNVTLRTLSQAMICPRWALELSRAGFPSFDNFQPYFDSSHSREQQVKFVGDQLARQVTPQEFAEIRQLWPGKLLVKGILHAKDAEQVLALGADGIVVSNHGGRQTDGAPTSIDALRRIRQHVGPDQLLILDSGVRCGLDVFRAMAVGADFVLIGRAFYYGMAALGEAGASHVIDILNDELTQTMRQMGVTRTEQIKQCEVGLDRD